MRGLERRLAEQDTVVRDDPDAEALDAGEAAHDRRAVQRLELVKTRAVDEPRDDLVHVVLRADVPRDQRVQVGRVVGRRLWRDLVVYTPVARTLQLRDDVPRDGNRVRIVEREMIGDPRHARVDVGAAEVLG